MKPLLIAAALIAASTSAHAAEDMSKECDVHTCYQTLPDAMMGNWSMADEEGIMERVGPDGGDFAVDKDKYYGVDDTCVILHVEKLAENLYTVQATCHYSDDVDGEPRLD